MTTNSTGIVEDRIAKRWACDLGHRHTSKLLAYACQLTRDHPQAIQWRALMQPRTSFQRALARWRPIPADQRDDEATDAVAAVRRGEFSWKAFRNSLGGWAFGAAACLAIVAVVAAADAVNIGVQWLVFSGHDAILLAALAAVVLVGVSVPVVRRPRVRKALHWLREAYS